MEKETTWLDIGWKGHNGNSAAILAENTRWGTLDN
jgi:hypothetical protein